MDVAMVFLGFFKVVAMVYRAFATDFEKQLLYYSGRLQICCLVCGCSGISTWFLGCCYAADIVLWVFFKTLQEG